MNPGRVAGILAADGLPAVNPNRSVSVHRNILFLVFMLTLSLAATGCGKKVLSSSGPAPRAVKRAPAPAPGVQTKGMGQDGPAPKGTFKPYTVSGQTYYPLSSGHGYEEEGVASWYGKDFHGKDTANGETYDMHAMTAAHRVLPMNTRVKVTNLGNGRSVVVRVNDRGPFVGGRIIDMSYAGAKALDMVGSGTTRVHLEAVAAQGRTVADVDRLLAGERYYVQVGAFKSKDNAMRLVRELKGRGFELTRMRHAEVNGEYFWRVQAGVFTGLEKARSEHAGLLARYPASFIIAD